MNSINFFHEQNTQPLDKFVLWSLSWGRTIVMVTELIALSAFLYRFGLDTQISDLNDKIKQQQTIITASQPIETRDRNLQSRLALAATLDTQATNEVQNILKIIDQSNGNVTFISIDETANVTKVDVTAIDASGLNTFVQDVRTSLPAAAISIDSLQTKNQTQQVEATITITIGASPAS